MLRPLHIAIDASRTTRAARTGTERYALELIRAMLASNQSSDIPHHTTLYFRDLPSTNLFVTSAHVTLKVIPAPRAWTHTRFALEIFRSHPDVTFVPAHTLPFVFPGKAVVTVHDLGYKHFPQAHPALSRHYLDRTTRYNATRASLVLADSQATRADLVRFYGTPEAKIQVVYPGVQKLVRAPDEQIQALRRKYQITDDYVLFVGTIQPRKNVGGLVRAFLHLLQEYPALGTTQLIIAGGRGWLSDQDMPAMPQKYQPNIRFLGFVPDNELAALYSGATIFAFPSLYEGFGFPVLEAMQCGTAVLCSNTSSLPELVQDAALTVEPTNTTQITNALADLLSNSAHRADLIARGYTNATRFNWHTAALQTWQALETAANG